MNDHQATPQIMRHAGYLPSANRDDRVELRFGRDPATSPVERQCGTAAGAPLSSGIYRVGDHHLSIVEPPAATEVTGFTDIHRHDNTALERLYTCSGEFRTRSEAEGFRRITYLLDRPDVMTTYAATIVAEKVSYPLQLPNGNPVDAREGDDGKPVTLNVTHTETNEQECALEITEEEQTFVFGDVSERRIASLLRGFSAPLILGREFDDDTPHFEMRFGPDTFNRWDDCETLVLRRVISASPDLGNGAEPKLPAPDAEAFREVLNSEQLDDALKAEALTLPRAEAIGDDVATIQVEKLVNARDAFVRQFTEAFGDDRGKAYRLRAVETEYSLQPAVTGKWLMLQAARPGARPPSRTSSVSRSNRRSTAETPTASAPSSAPSPWATSRTSTAPMARATACWRTS